MASPTRKVLVGRFGVHIAVSRLRRALDHPDARHPGLVAARQGPDHRLRLVDVRFASSTQTEAGRLPPASAQVEKDGKFVIEGNIFGDGAGARHQRLRHPSRRRRPNIRPARSPTSATA